MIDDLFLDTNVFDFGASASTGTDTVNDGIGDAANEGTAVRLTGAELSTFLLSMDTLNSKYNSQLVAEFPLNGLGILEKVTFDEMLIHGD